MAEAHKHTCDYCGHIESSGNKSSLCYCDNPDRPAYAHSDYGYCPDHDEQYK